MASKSRNNPLGSMTADQFLRNHWQRTPALFRQGYPGFQDPLSPEQLAGLACDPDVESRLVLEHGAHPWELRHGPFDDGDFGDLPTTGWTLLVQEANKHLQALALLLDDFSFLPNWRVDDVMVSFSPYGGSVGPHVDSYDVFLLQGKGRKRWDISSQPVTAEDFLPDTELCILKQFEPDQSWVLQPGDMLYLPPGISHHGLALDDCLTYSIGFRAPTQAELILGYAEHVAASLAPDATYGDPGLGPCEHPGEITADALARVRQLVRAMPLDDHAIDHWFGCHATMVQDAPPEPRRCLSAEHWPERLAAAGEVWRSEYSRIAYLPPRGDRLVLFVNGAKREIPCGLKRLVDTLCGQRRFTPADLAEFADDRTSLRLLCDLHNQGHLYFVDDDES